MDELVVKGIVTAARPQGEEGRRVSIITDRLGRVTAFARGGAKMKSHLIGKLRPFTAAEFVLAKGRGAYAVHGAKVMNSFEKIVLDAGAYAYGAYVLESGEYFSREGMPIEDAKRLLNLMYLTLESLEKNAQRVKEVPHPALVKSIYELRLLVLDGEYTLEPIEPQAAVLWAHVLRAPLSGLYSRLPETSPPAKEAFILSVTQLFDREVQHEFHSLRILREIEE